MENQNVWEQFQKLPPNQRREVADFIEFLAERKVKSIKRRKKRKKLSEEPIIGIWKDREDMKDAAQWVRNLRRQEWEQ